MTILNPSYKTSHDNYQMIATHDRGRLHIGYGIKDENKECYDFKELSHSLNSYRNFFSRFFAQLFGYSIDISINNKIYCVNRKDFKDHFKNITNGADFQCKSREYNYSNHVQKELTGVELNYSDQTLSDKIKASTTNFGSKFSNAKRNKLTYKLFHTIFNHESNKDASDQALKYINSGAFLDRRCYYFNSHGKNFMKYSLNTAIRLISKNSTSENFFMHHTPYTLAANNGMSKVSSVLFNKMRKNFNNDTISELIQARQMVAQKYYDIEYCERHGHHVIYKVKSWQQGTFEYLNGNLTIVSNPFPKETEVITTLN